MPRTTRFPSRARATPWSLRRLARRATGERASGVRRDRRLPPRAGVPIPDRASPGCRGRPAGRTSRRAARERGTQGSCSRGLVGDAESRDALARAATYGCGRALQAGARARRGETRARSARDPGSSAECAASYTCRRATSGACGSEAARLLSAAGDAEGRSASGTRRTRQCPCLPVRMHPGPSHRQARDLGRGSPGGTRHPSTRSRGWAASRGCARQLRASFRRFPVVLSGKPGASRRVDKRLYGARSTWLSQQGRQDSNLQPPVLETGALPIELRPYASQRWVAESR